MKLTKWLPWVALPLSVVLATSVGARTPDDLPQIQRETRIVEEVLQSALREEFRRELRVTRVEAEYLAPQGVLVAITLNTPWLQIDERGETSFQFHGDISLPEIPAMVTNILEDLQIRVAPYEPEALEELRELREEQRALRMEGREQRSELRAKRRALVRTDDRDDKRDLEQDIERIEEQLALIDRQYDGLSEEIERQYAHLREQPPAPKPAPKPARTDQPLNVDMIMAQAVCDYAGTLKSLDSDQYLTLAIRKGHHSRYLAFQLGDINQCSRGNLSAERLLRDAYQYEG